jgi:glucuronoarabinoxylan endo-1,4-beta-xylanase
MKFSQAHFTSLLVFVTCGLWSAVAPAQTVRVIDNFDPSGTGIYNYSGGQIAKVWTNWFGGAFQSLVWDAASDANANPNSGSLKITANFSAANNQFEVYDGVAGLNPPLSGLQYTNFQCDVRFAAGSSLTTNGAEVSFGHLEFGLITPGFGQSYFGSVDVPAANTNWVHVSLPIDAAIDTNLFQINDVLIHIYGPFYASGLNGASTFWVDNIQFLGAAVSNTCTIDWNDLHQRIDGFGASSAWRGTWTTSQADMFFSTNSGTGVSLDGKINFSFNGAALSLLRNHITYANSTSASATPSTAETSIMQYAQARGARIWSAPWTPPAGFKNTNDLYDANHATGGGINGGSYRGNGNNPTNLAYASQLANYVYSMSNTYHVNIYGISMQNEPDANVTSYEACQWTGQQFHDFVTNLSNALIARGVGSTKIILPESQNWASDTALYTPTLNDADAAASVAIVANHNYVPNNQVGDTTTPARLSTSGKALWETEVAQIGGAYDGSITNAIYWAGRIHHFLADAEANAWHYWWLVALNNDNEGLTDTNGVPAKRLYALGQFSRFVRPNYYRIGARNGGNVEITAFKDSQSANFAIVAINPNFTNVTQTFTLTNFPGAAFVAPWMTTSNLSLAPQTAVGLTNSSFTYDLPALSIVTFVGPARNITLSPPSVSGGAVSLVVTGQAGFNYTLLRSTDLVHWQPLMVSNPPSFPFKMTDTNFFFDGDAYYRIMVSP